MEHNPPSGKIEKKMKVRLINVGRGNVNTTVEAKNANDLRKKMGTYILSRNWDFEETDDPLIYDVVAGFRTIGKVEIIQS